MSRRLRDVASMSADERLRELAAILARACGRVRLRRENADTPSAAVDSAEDAR